MLKCPGKVSTTKEIYNGFQPSPLVREETQTHFGYCDKKKIVQCG